MRYIRTIGLSLVAVLALCAVAASSTSATEVLIKASTYPVLFTSVGGKGTLETTTGIKVTCTDLEDHGLILTAHLGDAEVLFLGCKTTIAGLPLECQTKSTGQSKGHIFLSSALFHVGLAHLSTGVMPAILFLLPEVSGVHEFTFECGGSSVKVTGEVIGVLEKAGGGEPNYNEAVSKAQVQFFQSGGVQTSTEFLLSLTSPENELMTGQHLTSESSLFGTHESGEEVTDTMENFSTGTIELVLG